MSQRPALLRWRWLWLPLALFITCAGWAVTSPVGSAPDDDFHLASIWCAAGEQHCQLDPSNPDTRLLPRNVAQAADCYRYEPAVTADCALGALADSSPVSVTHVNDVEHLYPTGFYRVMSLFVSDSVEASVLTMRLFNAALISMLLALLLRTVPSGIGFAVSAALVVTFIPLGISVVGSTNPSGWATAGVLLYWGFALALLHRGNWRNRRTWLIAGGAAISATLAVASRIDSSAYLAFATVLVLVLAGSARIRTNVVSSLVVATLGVLGVVSYLFAHSPAVGGDDLTMGSASRGLGLLATNAAFLPALFQGIVGGWPLGWNDTLMPPFVPIAGVLVIGGLAWAGLSVMWPRKVLGALLALGGLVAVPLWFLQKEGLGVGEMVQPRYIVALLSLLLATLLLDRRPAGVLSLPRSPAIVSVVALAVSGSLAFWANAQRYAYGSGTGLFDAREAPAWPGMTGVPLPVITLLAVISTVVLVSGVFVHNRRTPRVSA